MLKLLVIGHLGKDVIVNAVNGKSVMNFTVAHSEKYKDAQGVQIDKTTWVECAYWNDRTTLAPYLKKGTQVYVEGVPEVRSYTTNDGRVGASLSLRVSNIQLLGSKNADGSDAQSNSNYNSQPQQQAASTPSYQQNTPQPATNSYQPQPTNFYPQQSATPATDLSDDLPF